MRLGAFGDSIITTPLIRKLKEQGHTIIYEYSDRGKAVLANNPHIDEHVFYKADSVPFDKLQAHWDAQAIKYKADKVINLSETIEYALATHPRSPRYFYPKNERKELCNRNYYEYTFERAGVKWEDDDLRPELFFDEGEIHEAKELMRIAHFNILFCLSGSGKHKAYPWTEVVINEILEKCPNAHIITTGDVFCKLLEEEHDRVTSISGEADIRTSMALTGLVDLVVSPDTGILHAAGCYDTPKIGLLGHTTIENITKHFTNDMSIESDGRLVECSPCFKMIYDMNSQCPIDNRTGGAFCMSKGIDPNEVVSMVEMVYNAWEDSDESEEEEG